MRLGIMAGMLAGALWGTVFLAPVILYDFSPLFISIIRYIFYGIISVIAIAPIAKSILSRMNRKQFLILLKLVITGNIIYYTLLIKATQLIGIAPSSLIVGLVPVTVILFAHTKNSLPLKTMAGPILMILTGLFCINTDVFRYLEEISFTHKFLGIACAFAALISWTWYALDNAKYLQTYKDFSSNEWSLLFGVVTGMAALAMGIVFLALPVTFTLEGKTFADMRLFFLITFGLGLLPSFLGNICWNTASQKLPTSLMAQMIVFETLFALLYGFIYTQRLPRVTEVLAVFLLVGGVLWSIGKHRDIYSASETVSKGQL